MNSPLRVPANISRRAFLGAFGIGAGAFMLAGCTQRPSAGDGGGDSAVTLGVGWWGSDARHEATMAALGIITEKTGVAFKTDYGDWGSYWDKVTTQLSGGTAPDVLSMNFPGEITDYGSRGALLALDEHEGKGLDLSALSDAEIAPGRVDGVLYGVTLATASPALMVNTTKLGELGLEVPDTWTWEEFAEFANTVHDASDGRLHGAEDGTTGSVLESFLIQRGYPGVYDGASIAPSEEDFVDWFRYWADLRASGGTVTAEINAAFDGAHPNNPVVKGQAAIGMQFNITEEVWATLTEDVFDYGMYPSSTDLTGNYVKPAALFSVNAATKHPEEAVEFISTFISDSDVSKALALTRGLPNAEALKALEGTLTDKQRAFVGFGELVAAGQLSDAPTAPTGSGDVTALLTKYAGEVAFGNRDAAAGAKQFYAEATAVPLGG